VLLVRHTVADDPVHRLRRSVISILPGEHHGAQRLGGARDQSRGGVCRRTELERFDLRPYLPQIRKRWRAPHTGVSLMRRYPLFPRYILIPIGDTRGSAVRICRGLRRIRPILSDAEGRPWRANSCGVNHAATM
jgi:hypothetical protein